MKTVFFHNASSKRWLTFKSYQVPWFKRTLSNLLIIANKTNKALQGVKCLRSVTHSSILYLDYYHTQL